MHSFITSLDSSALKSINIPGLNLFLSIIRKIDLVENDLNDKEYSSEQVLTILIY